MVNSSYKPPNEKVSIGISLKCSGEFHADGTQASFVQHLTTSTPVPTETPFFLDVEFTAEFTLEPAPLPLEYSHYMKHILPNIVFPYMREYVADITRRAGFTPLLLGYNFFNEDPEEKSMPVSTTTALLH